MTVVFALVMPAVFVLVLSGVFGDTPDPGGAVFRGVRRLHLLHARLHRAGGGVGGPDPAPDAPGRIPRARGAAVAARERGPGDRGPAWSGGRRSGALPGRRSAGGGGVLPLRRPGGRRRPVGGAGRGHRRGAGLRPARPGPWRAAAVLQGRPERGRAAVVPRVHAGWCRAAT